MIRTLTRLMPAESRGPFRWYGALVALSVILRAVGVVLLVPLVAALFSASPGDAWPWLGALTAATFAGWLVDAYGARLGFQLGFTLLDGAQHDVADRLTRIRLDWFTSDNRRDARQAIAATGPELVGIMVYLITPMASAITLPIAIGLALLPFSWPLGLVALLCAPVLLAAYWASTRISRRADQVAAAHNAELTERIVEFARTQQALRAARRAEPQRSHVGSALAAQHGAGMRLIAMQIPGQLLFSLASQIALVLLAGATTWLTVSGELSVAQAVAMIVVIARFLEPFSTLGELSGAVESATGTLRKIRSVLDAPTTQSGSTTLTVTEAPAIELRDVHFAFDPEAPVLDGLSVVLEPGSTTAIVGPSGSGKSTILSIIAGLHAPTEGQVLIDGQDLARVDHDDARALRSVVFQHPYLFEGTIGENVRAGAPDADDGHVHAAIELARVDELVTRLPGGIDAGVGEAGVALSGGERQRVSIARALLKPAPVLLVDEATSALDTENERAVVHALTADPQQRTRVVVAHRLSSIREVDRVLFVDEGRIIEDGPVDELLNAGGRFAQFWREQAGTARWQLGSRTKPAAAPMVANAD